MVSIYSVIYLELLKLAKIDWSHKSYNPFNPHEVKSGELWSIFKYGLPVLIGIVIFIGIVFLVNKFISSYSLRHILDSISVHQLMTGHPIKTETTVPIGETRQIMEKNGLRALPIVKLDMLVGIITQNILDNIKSDEFISSESPVAKIMNRKVISLHTDDKASKALQLMKKWNMDVVAITGNQNYLVGTITYQNIKKFLQEKGKEIEDIV